MNHFRKRLIKNGMNHAAPLFGMNQSIQRNFRTTPLKQVSKVELKRLFDFLKETRDSENTYWQLDYSVAEDDLEKRFRPIDFDELVMERKGIYATHLTTGIQNGFKFKTMVPFSALQNWTLKHISHDTLLLNPRSRKLLDKWAHEKVGDMEKTEAFHIIEQDLVEMVKDYVIQIEDDLLDNQFQVQMAKLWTSIIAKRVSNYYTEIYYKLLQAGYHVAVPATSTENGLWVQFEKTEPPLPHQFKEMVQFKGCYLKEIVISNIYTIRDRQDHATTVEESFLCSQLEKDDIVNKETPALIIEANVTYMIHSNTVDKEGRIERVDPRKMSMSF